MIPTRGLCCLAGALSLGACVAPPGPAMMALPGKGKDLAAFQQDDAACRQYALPAAPGQSSTGTQPATPQQPPDLSYAQCMTARGNTVQPAPYSTAYAAPYPVYGYAPYPWVDPYPYYWGGFWGGGYWARGWGGGWHGGWGGGWGGGHGGRR